MSHLPVEEVACNICGNADVRVLRAPRAVPAEAPNIGRTFSSSSDEPLKYRLVACTVCGLQYVSPRPRAEAVLAGYAGGTDERFVSQARGREITFEKCLDIIERAWGRDPGRLLDIGAGGGSFPFIAARRGWNAEGCEPNRWLCDWARDNYGVDVRPGTVFEQHYPSGSYDVVTLWDVLEHTPDPRTEIRETHRLLKEDGLVVINYPDIGSWIARLMGQSWVFLLDVHLYYFTRRTICKLLEDAGFEVVRIQPHFQRLALGYILRRATPYVGVVARAADGFIRAVAIENWQMPYWIGQTLVIARKRRS